MSSLHRFLLAGLAGLCCTAAALAQAPAGAAPGAAAAPARAPSSNPPSGSAAGPSAAASAQALPLLYQSLEPFDRQRHRDLKLAPQMTRFDFARQATVLPIVVSEVSAALRSFPLVFIQDAGTRAPMLVALVGTGDGRNQFVGADGSWRSGSHIPAWVRRYPFFVAEDGQGGRVLAIDARAELFRAPDGLPLLDKDGEPGERLKAIIQFQNQYGAAFARTQEMARALLEAGVLEPAALGQQQAEGVQPEKRLDGLLVVSEKKLRELPPPALEKLRQADALGLAYAQIFSMASLPLLAGPAR